MASQGYFHLDTQPWKSVTWNDPTIPWSLCSVKVHSPLSKICSNWIITLSKMPMICPHEYVFLIGINHAILSWYTLDGWILFSFNIWSIREWLMGMVSGVGLKLLIKGLFAKPEFPIPFNSSALALSESTSLMQELLQFQVGHLTSPGVRVMDFKIFSCDVLTYRIWPSGITFLPLLNSFGRLGWLQYVFTIWCGLLGVRPYQLSTSRLGIRF